MANQWVNLHSHSHYSILDGYAKIDEYVNKAKARGDIGLGITDHGSMAGVYEFIKKCQDAGIKPVPGFEAYVAPENPEGAKVQHQVFYGPEGKKAGNHDVSGNGAYLHLTLFAYNNKGLHNLFKLSSLSWQTENFYMKPRIDTDMLFKYHEGLIVTTGCPSSEISTRFLLGQDDKAYEYASRLHEVFGDNMYVEIMNHDMPDDDMERVLLKKQVKLAKDLGLKLLATNDSHYANKSDADFHERMICMQSNNVMSEPPMGKGGKRFAFSGPEYYMKTDAEMRAIFPEDKFPGAVDNSCEIVNKCEDIELNYNPHLRPNPPLPEGETEVSYFKKLIEEGFKKKRGHESKEIQQESLKRIKQEFEVINSNDFVGYFLVVRDYIHWAHTHGVETGSGRGSVGGSEIAYVMDIGDTDPIKYDLLFERFLSPGRGALYEIKYTDGTKEDANTSDIRDVISDSNEEKKLYVHELAKNEKIKDIETGEVKQIEDLEVIRPGSAPDIDTDIHTEGRENVIQYVADTYGRKNVSNIITFGTFKAKNSLKSMATIYQIPFAEANKVAQLIPKVLDGKEMTLDDIYDPDNPRYAEAEDFRRAVDNDKWREVIKMARPLNGRIRETGIHACGLIISSQNLSDTIPTQVRQKDGTLLTQWTYPYCEALGLIKMDFLGLDTLDIMDNTLENIKVEGKPVPDMRKLVHVPMDDAKTYKMLQNAETTGIFQFGSPGMRDLLERVKPTKFEDLAAVTALYRPGPMKMNSHIEYADRKNGREKITYINPEFAGGPVEDVLKGTYGLCVPENTPVYDATRAQFVPIKELNPMTSTTMSINPDTKQIELKPITHVVNTGRKRILKLNLVNGHSIRVATTHPVLTDTGYVEAKDLNQGARIAVNRQEYPTLTNISLHDDNLAFTTGAYWQDNLHTNDEVKQVETYDNHTLKYILAGMYSTAGTLTEDKAVITFSNKDAFNDAKKIMTVLGIETTIKSDNKLSIVRDDFDNIIAPCLPDYTGSDTKEAYKSAVEYVFLKSVDTEDWENCYDIEVKDNHNFLIDNVIVHNCIYQEQCMQLATRAAGMSAYEADKLRKAIGHKKMKIMMSLRPKFIQGIEDKGYSEEAATQLWDTVQQFGQYGFNKSHSISYAINTYKTCYLKANYPAEFMSALIQQNTGEPKKVMMFLQEAKRMGLRVGPVDINDSQAFVAPASDKTKYDIIFGFSGIKQVSDELSNVIITERKNGKYKTPTDLVKRISDKTKLNSQGLKNLALAGAFDKMSVTRRAIAEKASALLNVAHKTKAQGPSLFDLIPNQNASMLDSVDLNIPEYPYTDLIKLEADVIGIYLSGSPTAHLGSLTHIYSPTKIAKIQSGEERGTVNILGSFTMFDAKTRKNGSRSISVRVDDGTGFFDVYLPNQLVNAIDKGEEIIRRKKLNENGKEIKVGTSKRAIKLEELINDEDVVPVSSIVINEPYLIQVKIMRGRDGQGQRLFITNFKKIVTAYDGSIPFEIAIPKSSNIKHIVSILNANAGNTYVRAYVQGKGWKFFNQRVSINQTLIENLERELGEQNMLTKGA